MAEVTVELTGALAAGDPAAVIDDMLRDCQWAMGGQALADVQQILDENIKRPTPYYETQVTVQWAGDDVVVHDRGIEYGPWLEGVSHLNEIRAFKGYHAFRNGRLAAVAEFNRVTDPIVARYLSKLGG